MTEDRPSPGHALGLVAAAQLILQLDFSIVNVALPTIQRELHMAPAELQWIVTGYALTFGSLLLLGGRIGDVVGHRRVLIIGLVLFGLTSLSAGLAHDPLMLIASRFAEGASAATVAPQALATLTDLYPEGPLRTRALGIYQGATAAGASAGIVLGGILTQYVGWRAIFLVNPPAIVVLLILMKRFLPRAAAKGGTRLDVGGAVQATASIAALIYALSEGQQHGFGNPLTVVALAAAVGLGVSFVFTERHVGAPMLPLGILTDPTRRVALTGMLIVGGVVAGYVYFVSLYLQRVLHFSALLTGIALIPATVTVMATSVLLTRHLVAQWGVKPLLLLGMASTLLGQVWLFRISATGNYPVNVLGGLFLTAFGMGLFFPTASVVVTGGVPASERGLAGGLFATTQQVGQAVGLGILATIAQARTVARHGVLVDGYQLAYLVSVCVLAAGLVLLTVQLRRAKTAAKATRPGPTAAAP